jgi:hypothetical protein
MFAVPAVVDDNVTPSLAQVQYFLGMERCLAGMTASAKPKWFNRMKQKALSGHPSEP